MQGFHRCSRCGFTTSLRLMGALSLTAAAVSGLELPAWPDRHVRSQSHCLSGSGRTSSAVRARCPCSPGPAAVQLSPVRGTCGTCVRARLCARTAPGIRTHGGSVYDERPNRYAIKASGWTVIDIWPDIDHGPSRCFYGIPVRSFITVTGLAQSSGVRAHERVQG